ncbi:hypothetical protein CHL76_13360 [Marinococcus halophilus]|uniref:Hydrolase n=2 Tax=Marinococcus halophilus TaxID=1371 RepID=A0A510YBM1_MARHA|nr:HAD family hydrolase [Marinococcus halophilus]OZT79256.1 hypothetical protein CHL76_13360 [Marinococcus halophilus]GEK59757.1 hypothetical protein MHA01_26620 [Marinococcus halophilus]
MADIHWNDKELLIFDLDGTLYEDTEHFDYYAERLGAFIPEKERTTFFTEYDAVQKGERALQIGTAYDAEKDRVLYLDPVSAQPIKVVSWSGKEMDPSIWKKEYAGFPFDFDKKIAIGDGWWTPHATARHFGVSKEEAYAAYVETKTYMSSEAFQLSHTPSLRSGLQWLQSNGKQMVLVTNSDDEDAEAILQQLNLQDLLPPYTRITSANKPAETKDHYKQLMEEYRVNPQETMVIGDNLMNDVMPGVLLGIESIHISPLTEFSSKYVYTVPSLQQPMEELIQYNK